MPWPWPGSWQTGSIRVECYLLGFGKLSKDCAINKQRLLDQGLVQFQEIGEGDPLPAIENRRCGGGWHLRIGTYQAGFRISGKGNQAYQ